MVKVLLLINVQHNYLEGNNPVPDAAFICDKIEKLIQKARSASTPPVVIWVRNCGGAGEPDQPDTYGWEVHLPTNPTEHLVDKVRNNVFDQDKLESLVPKGPSTEVYLCGMQSEYDLKSAAGSALERGNKVFLVKYAHGTFHTEVKRAARIQRDVEYELEQRGVGIVDADGISFEEVQEVQEMKDVNGAVPAGGKECNGNE